MIQDSCLQILQPSLQFNSLLSFQLISSVCLMLSDSVAFGIQMRRVAMEGLQAAGCQSEIG
jgi:hypothetical protein